MGPEEGYDGERSCGPQGRCTWIWINWSTRYVFPCSECLRFIYTRHPFLRSYTVWAIAHWGFVSRRSIPICFLERLKKLQHGLLLLQSQAYGGSFHMRTHSHRGPSTTPSTPPANSKARNPKDSLPSVCADAPNPSPQPIAIALSACVVENLKHPLAWHGENRPHNCPC